MKTQTSIVYNAVDITAKADSSYSIDDKQNFSNLDNLKLNKYAENKYTTLEKNFFILDGGKVPMPNDVNVAYWSNTMSDENGILQNTPTMTIAFAQKTHSSVGLTLTFSEFSYCSELTITYYDESNNELSTKTFEPDSYEYFCEQVVANYKKIVIEFKKMNLPYRYLKLYRVIFGKIVDFSGEALISANLLESVSILSDELSINTLEFVVYTDDDKFNILNPEGVYQTLQQRQIVNAYKIANGNTIDMGTFYLNSWQSDNDNKMRFTAIDLIGILDQSEFLGGMYTNETVENLITSIMTSAGISDMFYEIEDDLKDVEVSGYIPICTHRQALQQILFVIGALANCTRSDKIKIYKASESEDPNRIDKSNVLKGSRKINQGDLVTGISVVAHQYSTGEEEKTLYRGTLNAGVHTIRFSEPVYDLRFTSGPTATILSSSANYAKIEIQNTGSFRLYGVPYAHETQNILVEDSELLGNEKANILKIEEDYLINVDNATEVANRILDYYKNNYITTFDFIQDDEEPSDNVIVEESFGNILNGYITQLDIDMTGGYKTTAEVVAKVGVADG